MSKQMDLKHSSHHLSKHLASMVNDPPFEEAMRNADRNADIRGFLLVKALGQIALDPLAGDTPEAFYEVGEKEVLFILCFHTYGLMFGLLSLPADSARAHQLMEAVKANLNSKMFKAAKMYRRLERRRVRLYEHAVSKALRAYNTILEQSGWRPGRPALKEVFDRADAVYDTCLSSRMAVVNARVSKVADAAKPGFKSTYSEAMADFLYWNLPYSTQSVGIGN